MAVARRLKKELVEVLDSQYDVEETVNYEGTYVFNWQIALHGPLDSPYFGGTFILTFDFPKDYPFGAPSVRFKTKIYHPNIDHKGNICLGILKDEWKPTNTVSFVLKAIIELLKNPKPKDPLNVEAAKLYLDDQSSYIRKTAEITHKYAMTED